MSILSIAGLLLMISSAVALQCHQVPNQARLTDPITSTSTECGFNALSCTKVVDMTNGVYTKACGISNCTNPQGTGNLPAQCFNTSQQGRETYNCCCYGNGCNTASEHNFLGVLTGSLIFILASKFFM
ncbi:unnamed protein product [Auanema sp. JU1783]|nr:unnamed protein product [Auanema sp. JU1783]